MEVARGGNEVTAVVAGAVVATVVACTAVEPEDFSVSIGCPYGTQHVEERE
jgi:hypothetical protein